MTYDEIINKKDEGDDFLWEKSITKKNGFVVIDSMIPLSIITSQSYDRTVDINVTYPSGINIGKIIFLNDHKVDDFESLNDEKRICFYLDHSGPIAQPEYTFKNDYFLLKERYLNRYLSNYKESAPIWGSFFHSDIVPSINWKKKKLTSSISTANQLSIDNSLYFDNLFLSHVEPNPFTRFLKLYHLLELQFDLHTAEAIKKLLDLGNKEREISSKLRDYANKDINRLQSLLLERCNDLDLICQRLNEVAFFESKAIDLFYITGRESNPLRKKTDFLTIINNSKKFDETVINKIAGYDFQILIPKLAAYWIYRIRSSIAHNKFGEYIMDTGDEEFIVKFAEPLLKEVVKQCFIR
ncbi:MAG: hypothetical protein WD607_01455 [Candidatus Paceibacterota bacterium]